MGTFLLCCFQFDIYVLILHLKPRVAFRLRRSRYLVTHKYWCLWLISYSYVPNKYMVFIGHLFCVFSTICFMIVNNTIMLLFWENVQFCIDTNVRPTRWFLDVIVLLFINYCNTFVCANKIYQAFWVKTETSPFDTLDPEAIIRGYKFAVGIYNKKNSSQVVFWDAVQFVVGSFGCTQYLRLNIQQFSNKMFTVPKPLENQLNISSNH